MVSNAIEVAHRQGSRYEKWVAGQLQHFAAEAERLAAGERSDAA